MTEMVQKRLQQQSIWQKIAAKNGPFVIKFYRKGSFEEKITKLVSLIIKKCNRNGPFVI